MPHTQTCLTISINVLIVDHSKRTHVLTWKLEIPYAPDPGKFQHYKRSIFHQWETIETSVIYEQGNLHNAEKFITCSDESNIQPILRTQLLAQRMAQYQSTNFLQVENPKYHSLHITK